MKRSPKLAQGPRAEAREWISRLAGIVALIGGVDYLAWRFTVRLNPEAMWLSLPVWLADLYGLLSSFLFFFIVWGPIKRRVAPPLASQLSVDIFVPTYNEPLWIVRRTLLGARNAAFFCGSCAVVRRTALTDWRFRDGDRDRRPPHVHPAACPRLAISLPH